MTERRGTHIRLGREIHEAGELPSAIFMERAAAEGLHEIRSGNWPTSVKSLEGVGTPIARTTSQGGDSALFEDNGVLTTAYAILALQEIQQDLKQHPAK